MSYTGKFFNQHGSTYLRVVSFYKDNSKENYINKQRSHYFFRPGDRNFNNKSEQDLEDAKNNNYSNRRDRQNGPYAVHDLIQFLPQNILPPIYSEFILLKNTL